MSQHRYRIVCGACFAFFFLATEVMSQVPRADLRGQLSRYRTSTTRAAATTPSAIPARSAFPTSATGTARGRQTLSQFQLLQLQQQLLLQQQLNPQLNPFALVTDGRGGVVAVPVVSPQAATPRLSIPVGGAAVQQPGRRVVNRIRVGK